MTSHYDGPSPATLAGRTGRVDNDPLRAALATLAPKPGSPTSTTVREITASDSAAQDDSVRDDSVRDDSLPDGLAAGPTGDDRDLVAEFEAAEFDDDDFGGADPALHPDSAHRIAPHPAAGGTTIGAGAPRRVLLVWDAPNLDMGLGSILGGRPTAAFRPRFDALGRWLLQYTAELAKQLGEPVEAEATVFANIAPGSADIVRPWVEALRNVGYAVFAKPKIDEASDVDLDMLNHMELRRYSPGLAAVIVASADGQAFLEPLREISTEGTAVSIIGFREHATWAVNAPDLDFVDLEDIPGVFREPLPRVSLDQLPDDGAWLQPFRPLSSLLSARFDGPKP